MRELETVENDTRYCDVCRFGATGACDERCELRAYDGAPRAISPREAQDIARLEYGYRRGERAWLVLHRGADGGMHLADIAYSEAAARGSSEERTRALVRRILAGECTRTVFYDRARDRFYCG